VLISVIDIIIIIIIIIITYLLTPWSSVLEKLTGSAASQETPRILWNPKVPAACPYPEPNPSSPHNPLPLPDDPS
jgi:hypothetical protein